MQNNPYAKVAVQEMQTGVKIVVFLFWAFSSTIAQNAIEYKEEEFHVGVILDMGTAVGKVAHTSILIAVKDFYAVHLNYTTRLVLHIRDSMSDDVQAASAGKFHPQIWILTLDRVRVYLIMYSLHS